MTAVEKRPATSGNGKGNAEAQVRTLIERWEKSVRAKAIDALLADYAEDVVVCDMVPPLVRVGKAAHRKNWESIFAMFSGPIDFEITDLEVTAGDEAAFSHSLNRVGGKRANGDDSTMWVRVTVGFRKVDGKWLVTHEHASVPIDMESGKGMFDLKP